MASAFARIGSFLRAALAAACGPEEPGRREAATKLGIQLDGSEDTGQCPDCGQASRTVCGRVHRGDETLAAYWVHWTLGHVSDHGAHFDFVLGPWGDGAGPESRVAASLEFRRVDGEPSFMVIDAATRPVSASDLAGRALTREGVIGTPLAAELFAMVDAVWLGDPRIEEITGASRAVGGDVGNSSPNR